jgi:hypothetical protein
LIGTIIVGVGAALIYWQTTRVATFVAKRDIAAEVTRGKQNELPPDIEAHKPQLSNENAQSRPDDFRTLFQQSTNYWKLAQKILSAANSGNADAQVYLSKTLTYCSELNKFYFQHRGTRLSLDEGLQYAAKRNLPYDIAQKVYERCHDFNDNDTASLGDPAEWLARATSARQPLAQALTASAILMQNSTEQLKKASGVANPDNAHFVAGDADPFALLRDAVRSRDPEVLFNIGEAQALRHSANADGNTVRYAWWLVACERGFDCSANADWVKTSCGGTNECASAQDPTDLVRNLAGENWPAVQRLAADLNAKMEGGQWDELGIGP